MLPAAHARTRPPRAPNLVLQPDPDEVGARVDWSDWYLTDEDDMGQSPEHGIQAEDFLSSMKVLKSERGWPRTFLGADAFFGWVESEPAVRVSPDVYLLDDPPRKLPRMFETWKRGIQPPRFALEVVGKRPERVKKDLEQNPPKYAQLGTRELVVFDPIAVFGSEGRLPRVALSIFRRDADGVFLRVYAGPGTQPVRCEEIDAWVVVRVEEGIARLRICRDADGAGIVPTEGERIEQEAKRAEQEAQRAEEEAKRAEEEAKRAEQEAARAEQEATRADREKHRADELERRLQEALDRLQRT
ncbi:MAG: Uma2 family endonuclease [Deltaproteobacteria bacterium]|nr:Uma2 family endonuclease [Deltaproteobacteria bacterium]